LKWSRGRKAKQIYSFKKQNWNWQNKEGQCLSCG